MLSEHNVNTMGGIQNNIKFLGDTLKKLGHAAIYLSASDLPGIRVLNKKIIFPMSVIKFLKQEQPDIVHVHGFSSFFVAWCLFITKKIKPDIKLIYTPYVHPFQDHNHPRLAKLFFHLLLKQTFKNIDCIIALTEREKTFLSLYIDVQKIKVIPNGISLVNTSLYKEKPTHNRLLFIGRNDHNKRLDFLQMLETNFREMNLQCDIVTNQSSLSNDVFTYHTNVDDHELKRCFQQATVLVVPSKYESFSIVSLEAMHFGLPVLISDHVQIKSYFGENTFGNIFEYDNSEDFISKLKQILHIDADVYQERSKQNILFSKQFDWKTITLLIIQSCYMDNK